MTILVIGGTGTIGSLVAAELAKRNAPVRVLTHKGSKGKLDVDVDTVAGDVLDIDFMRSVLAETRTLFVLNPPIDDEHIRALGTLDLAQDAGIERVVYFSMINADTFTGTPHASAKYAAERHIKATGLPTTILRPNYFFQDDLLALKSLSEDGVYPMVLGGIGVTMVDARDIAEVAALELIRRNQAEGPLPIETIEIVGRELFTGESMAAFWSKALGRPIRYGGDDIAGTEQRFRETETPAMAYDQAQMFKSFVSKGMLGSEGAADRIEQMLGRPLRRYHAFAEECIAQMNKGGGMNVVKDAAQTVMKKAVELVPDSLIPGGRPK